MLKLKSIDLKKKKLSTLAVPVCEDKDIHQGLLSKLAGQAKKIKEFSGKKDQEITLYNPVSIQAERVLFIGLGKQAEINPEKLRAFSGKAVKSIMKNGLKELVMGTPSPDRLSISEKDLVTAMLEGACLGNHVFDHYKEDKKLKPLKHITMVVPAGSAKKLAGRPKRIVAICFGTLLARVWVSTPSNDKSPAQLS